MGEQDITLRMLNGSFNLRVGAIILHSGKILMVKNSGSSFYYTVGGRAKFGEAARDSVLREALEETQIQFEIDRLAFVHENFFVLESNNEPIHEITLFFLMKPNPQVTEIKRYSYAEEYAEVTLHWLPIDAIENLYVYPEFFKTELMNLSNNVKHFITKGGVTYHAV